MRTTCSVLPAACIADDAQVAGLTMAQLQRLHTVQHVHCVWML